MRVIDLMTTHVLTARPEDPLKSAARTMVDAGVSGLPVIDGAGKLIGIITEADFVTRQVAQEQKRHRRLLDVVLNRREEVADADTVGEAMTARPAVIYPTASLTEAARVMVAHGVKRLPVVDENGALQGIISRADIVAAFTRPDDVIEEEVREDVVRRVLFLDPDVIDVRVVDGVVGLSGELNARSDVRLLEELVARLDGVVRVDNRLSWRVDDTKTATESPPGLP